MKRRVERRRFPRRAKSLRVWFEHADEQHRAVSTVVGLGGAFFKASHLPQPGSILTLHERFKVDGGGVSLRCEVVWLADRPTLERPDTGFGVRFLEAVTRADPSNLEEFLLGLGDERTFEIALEERAHGAYSVFRFPTDEALPAPEVEHDFTEHDEPAVIDLQRELDRLGREERKRDARVQAPTPAIALKNVPPPTPVEPDLPRTRKKRRITGLFTALFSRQRDPAQPEERASRLEVELHWQNQNVRARLEAIGPHGAALAAASSPLEGGQLVMRPLAAAPHSELAVVAIVTRREGRPDGTFHVSLDFLEIDERGDLGRFERYLELVNGTSR